MRVDIVPDPTIEHPRDAVIRITAWSCRFHRHSWEMAKVAVLRETCGAFGNADPDAIEHDRLWTCITDHSTKEIAVEFHTMAADHTPA